MQVVRGQPCRRPECRVRSRVRCSSSSARHPPCQSPLRHPRQMLRVTDVGCPVQVPSATIIVANDGRYLHRYVADHDSSLKSTSPSLLQPLVSRKGVIRFCSALCSCRRTNQTSNHFLQDHQLAPVNQIWNSLATSQWPWDTMSLLYSLELNDSPSTTDRTNGVALGSGRAE